MVQSFLKFLICIKYSPLSCKSATKFFNFLNFSFFETKSVNHCEDYVNFQDIEDELQQNILHHFHHYSFN